ncbi:hypothetical protein ACL1HE_12810, partial [Corynebacterium striatum]
DATPADRGAANINYERKPLAVPGTWNPGTNYADSRYQLPQIDIHLNALNSFSTEMRGPAPLIVRSQRIGVESLLKR